MLWVKDSAAEPEATLRALREIDDVGYAVTVLMLSTFNDDEAVYAALRAGASGFILESAAPSDLAAAIRAVANGDDWLDPAVARKLLDEFAARPIPALPTPEETRRLTRRETEVLVLVAHGLWARPAWPDWWRGIDSSSAASGHMRH